ncbi:hypothetical protein [Sphingopyxis sp.]|uniref:hypothetical protein n=1 Tax=Sphingopyxis sp. TaxID=1908224 RepID=UPI002D765634|nr:hypothetical protein [Sphingopyxis sp.]HET6526119.1 hypothetical protein [Sphingopyxis sp.]
MAGTARTQRLTLLACRPATFGAENKPERRPLSCSWSEEKKAAAVQPALPMNGSYMPKYPNAIDRAEEMETLRAALAIVRTAGLELDEKVPILPVKCAHYLIAADADLLIVPASASTAKYYQAVEDIMGLSRCDALMVYVARPGTGSNRVVVNIGIHGFVPLWHREYRPCLIEGVLHFVPDQDASKPAFKLTRRGLTQAADFDATNPDFASPTKSGAASKI